MVQTPTGRVLYSFEEGDSTGLAQRPTARSDWGRLVPSVRGVENVLWPTRTNGSSSGGGTTAITIGTGGMITINSPSSSSSSGGGGGSATASPGPPPGPYYLW